MIATQCNGATIEVGRSYQRPWHYFPIYNTRHHNINLGAHVDTAITGGHVNTGFHHNPSNFTHHSHQNIGHNPHQNIGGNNQRHRHV